jgi:glycerophosphoryl diester phosphodiesterase
VNDRAEVERLLAAGVSAVFSDRPDLWRRDEM